MISKTRFLTIVWTILWSVTTYGKTPIEAGRDLIVRYGVNPYYKILNSVKCPYKDDSEEGKTGTGWFIDLPDEGSYEVTVADETFIRDVAYKRQSIREEFRQLNYPLIMEGTGMTIQYAYFDDESASCVYFYVCDESIHDMNQKMRESGLSKLLLKKTILSNLNAERFASAFVNIKYVYVGDKSGLTSYINFDWDELYDYVHEK